MSDQKSVELASIQHRLQVLREERLSLVKRRAELNYEKWIIPIDLLGLSTHASNSLRHIGITTIADILDWRSNRDDWARIRNWGEQADQELEVALRANRIIE